jgi:hypothetical protein
MIRLQGGWDGTSNLQNLGWMVLALVIFTVWNPLIAIVGSLAFAFLYSIPSYINADMVTGKFLVLIPYIMTVVVLIFTSIFGKKNVLPPGSLGVNYFREERYAKNKKRTANRSPFSFYSNFSLRYLIYGSALNGLPTTFMIQSLGLR